MEFTKKIFKFGGSIGILIPAEIKNRLCLKPGDMVRIDENSFRPDYTKPIPTTTPEEVPSPSPPPVTINKPSIFRRFIVK